ncbi:MAG: DUF4404 family protein [Pirellulales bacterium]
MENKRLLDTLKQLHVELTETQHVDPETLELLATLTKDIESVSQRQETASEEMEPVASGLRDLMLKFEAEHPQFSAAAGKVADALAAMGF